MPSIESICPKAQTTDQEHHHRNPGPKTTPAHALVAGNTAPKKMKTSLHEKMMRDIQTRIVEHTRRTKGCPKTRILDAIRINQWLVTEGHF